MIKFYNYTILIYISGKYTKMGCKRTIYEFVNTRFFDGWWIILNVMHQWIVWVSYNSIRIKLSLFIPLNSRQHNNMMLIITRNLKVIREYKKRVLFCAILFKYRYVTRECIYVRIYNNIHTYFYNKYICNECVHKWGVRKILTYHVHRSSWRFLLYRKII